MSKPYNSINPGNSAKGQAKKAEAEIMQTKKPPKINSTKKQQQPPNKYNNCKKKSTKGNNETADHTAIASKRHQHPTPKEEQEISFNTGNLVTIWNYKHSVWNSNSDTANVIGLGKRMGLSLSHKDIIDMDVHIKDQNYLDYEVYFCSKHVKEAFLAKSHILKEFPETKCILVY